MSGYILTTPLGGVLFCGYRTDYQTLPVAVLDTCFAVRCFMYEAAYPHRVFFTNMQRDFQSLGVPDYQFSNFDGEYVFDLLDGKAYAAG
jgi:hypothetical protein